MVVICSSCKTILITAVARVAVLLRICCLNLLVFGAYAPSHTARKWLATANCLEGSKDTQSERRTCLNYLFPPHYRHLSSDRCVACYLRSICGVHQQQHKMAQQIASRQHRGAFTTNAAPRAPWCIATRAVHRQQQASDPPVVAVAQSRCRAGHSSAQNLTKECMMDWFLPSAGAPDGSPRPHHAGRPREPEWLHSV